MEVSSKPQLSEMPHASDRFLVQLMRFLDFEFCLVVELTINDDINVVCELIALEVAGNLHPTDMWDRDQNRKAFNQLTNEALSIALKRTIWRIMDDGREFSTRAP